jgi:hypothetical protein
MNFLKNALGYAGIGALVMCGMAAADWVIPDAARAPVEFVHKLDAETACLAEKGGAR